MQLREVALTLIVNSGQIRQSAVHAPMRHTAMTKTRPCCAATTAPELAC
jgi:hypothetical protein